MGALTSAERELVALGAALGSNCVPCIEYHIPEARKAGLDDRKIHEAVLLADKVRQVPARKVMSAALQVLTEAQVEVHTDPGSANCDESLPVLGSKVPCCK